MTADKKTLLRDALKFVQQGKVDKAIEAYRAIVKDDPKDVKVQNSLGDLYIRQGKKKEGIAAYLEVATLYERDGFALRSIAILQKIINLDAEQTPVRLRLGDLYAAQKLPAEARAQYLQVADYLDKRGDVAAALDVFRKIANLDPDNLAVRVKLAGMFEKQKFPEKAAEEYVRAAKGYQQKKEAATAADLFQRAVKLHPANLAARRGLAEHHASRQEWPMVVAALDPVVSRDTRETDLVTLFAEACLHQGRTHDAVAVLQKAQEREPNSAPVNLALGRAHLKSGELEPGIAALNRTVGAYLAENRHELAEALLREMSDAAPEDDRIQQRILEVAQKRGDQPAVAQAYQRLAGIYERKGQVRNALGALEKCLELVPADAAVTRRLAELRKRVPVPPPPPEAPAAAPSAPAPPAAPASPPAPPPASAPPAAARPVPPPAPLEEDVVEVDLEGEDLAQLAVEEGEEEFELEVEGEEAPPAVEPRTLADAAACLAGGACEKAAGFLEGHLREHPADVEAAGLLCQARRAQGNRTALRDALNGLAELHRREGRFEDARRAYREALDADPRSPKAALALAELVVEEERLAQAAAAPPAAPPAPAAPAAQRPPPPLPAATGAEEETELTLDLEPDLAPDLALEPEPVPEPVPEPILPPTPAATGEPSPIDLFERGTVAQAPAEEVEVPFLEEIREEAAAPATAESPPPVTPAPPAEDQSAPQFWGMEELLEPPPAAPLAEGSPKGFGREPVAAAPPPPPPPPAPPPAPPVPGVGAAELEEFLAEANFYFQQGLLDEAEFLYNKLQKLAPGHPEIAGQIRRLEVVRLQSMGAEAPAAAGAGAGAAPGAAESSSFDRELDLAFGPGEASAASVPEPPPAPPAQAEPTAASPGGDFSDFLSELRQELETQVPAPAPPAREGEGLTEIFQEFQRSVKEQLGEEDYETHYNLGIAYKEMGLLEEALGEFSLAERSPVRRMDAVSMIALCLREMGRFDEAVRKLRQGISLSVEGSEEQKGFLYDLAALHQGAGRSVEALEALRRIHDIDPRYRDVAARLQAAPAPAPASAPAPPPRRKPKVSYL
jgi:tetratricopeptide (TPR) repeat protein